MMGLCERITTNGDIGKGDSFYKQLPAVQDRLPKGDIAIVIDDLNTKATPCSDM